MNFENWLWDAQQYAEKIGSNWDNLTEIVCGEDHWETLFEEGLTPEEAVDQVINQSH